MAWFEIGTADIEASKAFSAGAFGWNHLHDTGVTSRPYFAAVTPGAECGSGGHGTTPQPTWWEEPLSTIQDMPFALA
ncbi:hypothetical protein [Streptomyces chattanoogensis]|uniref:Uncharacterized protein n=1 Tax=Streptomyces chattanoogensis TaxID=66876 RepID=A0A0N0GYD9_9ACTN|nr:hypothetical protein [Streptomyces chattanoogensis]KPC61829.1 hypothetical protein ADL29_22380 [Streptomyces chattanoogensis]